MSDHALKVIDLDKLAADRGGHSSFAPSASARWLTCPGSLIPGLLAPDTAGYDAALGTVAHSMAELWLKSGERPSHLVGTTEAVDEGHEVFVIEIDDTMLDNVQTYVDWCEAEPGDHYVEQRVYFSQLTPIPNQGGTADFMALRWQKLVVIDYKNGIGERVQAAEDMDDPRAIIRNPDGTVHLNGNSQAMLYALGVFFEHDWLYDFQTIEIRIAQPRLDNFPVWVTTREHLLEFADWVKGRAAIAWQLNAPRHPSPKACRFCPVKATCTAFIVQWDRMTDGVFDNLDDDVSVERMQEFTDRLESDEGYMFRPVDPTKLTTKQMAKLLPWRSAVERWWSDLAQELETRALNQVEVPGYKLVESRSFRVYRDAAKAAEHLDFLGLDLETIWDRTMISPAKAEDALRKVGYKRKQLPDLLSSVVRHPPGRPTLAPVSDNRPALNSAANNPFDDLDGDL